MWVDRHYHKIADDRAVPIAALIREPGHRCFYMYDLGDGWEIFGETGGARVRLRARCGWRRASEVPGLCAAGPPAAAVRVASGDRDERRLESMSCE